MTPAGALKAAVVAASLPVAGRVYRRRAPEAPTFPYVTFFVLSDVPVLRGDGRTIVSRQALQWDLWEKADTESDLLLQGLIVALDEADLTGVTFNGDARAAWGSRVENVNDVDDPDVTIVHHALTVAVYPQR